MMIIKIDRSTYRKVKQMNREQLERYINQIYVSGFNEGFDTAGKPVAIPFTNQELSKILFDELKIKDIELGCKIQKALTQKYKLLEESIIEKNKVADKE